MKIKAQIWIVNDSPGDSRVKSLLKKIKPYYKVNFNFITSEELSEVVSKKVHLIIFEWTDLKIITNSWFNELRERNLHAHSLYFTKSFSENQATKISNKTIDYILAKDNSDNYILAKIRNILRRKSEKYSKDTELFYKDLRLDLINQTCFLNNKEISLSNTEFKVLKILMNHVGEFVSKEIILDKIWGYDDDNSRIVTQYIFRLRQKLSNSYILSVHGKGFILK